MAIELDRDRFVSAMQAQAEIGATDGGGLDRLALSEADREARDWFCDRLRQVGAEVRVDAFGNVFGYRPGVDEDAGTVLVGSHLDSQPRGGIYDGALGVVAGLELLAALEDRGVDTRRGIEVVDWTNEEGSRFQPAMQGSGVWAGVHDLSAQYGATDADGTTLRGALERIGYLGDAPAEPAREYDAYLELHVEQGPVLEETGSDVGVVTGIGASTWGAVTYSGEADHAGPTPMHARGDALVAAADAITAVRRLPAALGEQTVATVGRVDVDPDSINVIPGEATFTWDLRDPDDGVVADGRERIEREARAAARREGVDCEVEDWMRLHGLTFTDRPVDAVERAAGDLGYDARRLFSMAAHDALHAAEVCDAGMVFAVSEDGRTHSEAEYTSWPDCYRAANTLATAALDLADVVE